ncbi:MAG: MBL fold metallo-hydrolase [Parasphingorhabdus sp.]
MKRALTALGMSLGIVMGTSAAAHDVKSPPPTGPVMTLDEIGKAFGWDFENTEIKTEKVADGLYVLFGVGGNIAASVGEDGTLIVDDQFPQLMPKIKAALKEIGSDKVDFVINTHWHFDHADGNMALGKDGTWIVSQSNSREKMRSDHIINLGFVAYEQKAYPAHAISDITYDTTMQFHINGEKIDLLHVGPAHTTGDTAIIFRGKNAVHLGDVFNNSGYPFVDADNGGDIEGMIAFCQAVHDTINDDTKVIPGHGPVTTRAKLARYIEVLTIIKDRVQTMIDDGKDLNAIVAAKPTAEFDKEFYGAEVTTTAFVGRVYASLIKK